MKTQVPLFPPMEHTFSPSFRARRAPRPCWLALLVTLMLSIFCCGSRPAVAAVGDVSTLAGSTRGFADGAGTAAQFDTPYGVAVDSSGNLYVADSSNNRIRKVTPSGVVSTLAGSTQGFADGAGTAAQFATPFSVAVDRSGNLYIADFDNNRIRKVTPAGVVSTLAGGTQGFADGVGTAAQFNTPRGVAVDSSGNVYVGDSGNNRIRKVTPAGVVTTLAGGTQGFADGAGTAAQFDLPAGVTVDSSGNVYVADAFNYRIRKVTPAGVVSTLAGSTQGFADGAGTAAQFDNVYGVAVDGGGNVYVADTFNNRIRKVTPSGVVSTLAGSTQGFADGAGTAAQFSIPVGVAVDGSGNVYVADSNNNRIRKVIDAPPAPPTPTITNFTPTRGPIGTQVTINGTNFTGATAVRFGGVSTANFTVNAAGTQIVVAVPTGAQTGVIGVTTPGGSSDSTGTFTVTETPSLVVTTTSDVVSDADNLTSLREAVNFANSRTGATSAITFDPTVFAAKQTISLTIAANLILAQNVTITGPAAGVTIAVADKSTRADVFQVNSNVNASFSGLTLTNGRFGVFNVGGTLALTNCTLTGNNDGYYNNSGTGTLVGCTSNGNDTSGVTNNTGPVTLTNCTSSGNGLFGIANSGTMTVANCTVISNIRSGLFNSGTLNLNNSIVAGSAQSTEGNAPITNGGNNVLGGTADEAGLETSDGQNAVVLKDNGGPTQTIALVKAGRAIDAGATQLTTDQRGQKRPARNAPDIGAYEAQNAAPSAKGFGKTLLEDGSLAFALADFNAGYSDPEGDALQSITIVAAPANGALSLNGNVVAANQSIAASNIAGLLYTPNPNFNGADSFSFAANDSFGPSNLVTVTIAITPVNDAPSFTVGPNQTVDEDAGSQSVANFASDIQAGPADENAQKLNFLVSNDKNALFSAQPAIGPNGTLTYTPAPNANGTSVVTVQLMDDGKTDNGGADKSAAQSFTLTIAPVNDAPVAADQSVTTAEDTATAIVLSATDVDGNPLTYRVTTQPAQGTLSGTAPNLTYTPAADFNGADSFIFVANDGTLDSAPATVSIAVTPVNDAPVSVDRSEAVNRNQAKTFALIASDVEGDDLTYTVLSGPTVGTLSGAAPNLTYTPRQGYSGNDTLTFRANDGKLDSNVATVTFVVGADNDAPVAASQSVVTNEDTPLAITLSAADRNGDTITYKVVAPPQHGILSGTAPNLIYTPDGDFNQTDFFTFSANDGTVDGNIATVSIDVLEVNDVPSFSVGADQTLSEASGPQSAAGFAANIKAGPANEANQKLTFAVTNDNPELFSVQPAIDAQGTLTYTLAPKAAGVAKLSVVLKDDGGVERGGVDTSVAQNFTITVTGTPLFIGVSLNPAGPFTRDKVTATPRISDSAGVTYNYDWRVNGVSVQNGPNNVLDLSRPGFGDKGDIVSVTLTANNTRGGSGIANNRVTVRNSNPFAFSGTATVNSGEETLIPFKLFGNPGGGDADNEALFYKRVGGPKNGVGDFETDAGGNNALRYTSRRGFVGTEVVRFVAIDGEGRTSNVATLSIRVQGTPLSNPTANDASGKTVSGVQVDVPVTGTEPGGGKLSFKRVGGPRNGVGEFVTLANGTTVLRYTPRANFVGIEEIRFVSLNSDGRPSDVAMISITVAASGASALQTGGAPASDAPAGDAPSSDAPLSDAPSGGTS